MNKNQHKIAKQVFIFIIFMMIVMPVFSQPDSLLLDLNTSHLQIKKRGMGVLSGWALTNMAVSGYMMTRTKGVSYHFHEMNVFWNIVNLGIGAGSYYGAMQTETSQWDALQSITAQKDFGKILLFNAGLDVGYIMTGFYLRERAKNTAKYHNRLKGYGNSLLLQGGFLLLFDITLYGFNQSNLNNWLDLHDLSIQISPVSLSMVYQF